MFNASLDQLTSVSVHELYNYVCKKKFDKDIQKAVRSITFGGSGGIHCPPVGGRAYEWTQLKQESTNVLVQITRTLSVGLEVNAKVSE